MNHYIYAIQHKETGRIYVGQTNDIQKRVKKHIQGLRLKKHHNKLMQEDYDKYGEDYAVFTLEACDEADTKNREREWMRTLHTYDPRIGYNANDPYFRKDAPTIKPINVEYVDGLPTINRI